MQRRLAVGLVAAAVAAPAVVRAQTAPVRIGAVASDTYAESLYATDGGFFARAGIDVDVHVFPGSGAVAAAAAGNAIDVGLTDAVVLANARSRGVVFPIIAAGGTYESGKATSFVCVKRGAPYKTAKDFEGQAIAVVTLVSISSCAMRLWLAKNGAAIERVRFIEMPFPEMAPALDRGTIAGAFLADPSLSRAEAQLSILGDAYASLADRFAISNWFATSDWLARNPGLAKRMVGAIYATAQWSNAHPDLTAPILLKYAKLEPELAHRMRRCPYATSLTPGLLQPVLDAAARFSLIPAATNAADLIARLPA